MTTELLLGIREQPCLELEYWRKFVMGPDGTQYKTKKKNPRRIF